MRPGYSFDRLGQSAYTVAKEVRPLGIVDLTETVTTRTESFRFVSDILGDQVTECAGTVTACYGNVPVRPLIRHCW
jgi:hypothetical protein